MRIRIKEKKSFGEKRIDALSTVDSVLVKENILEPEKAHVAVYFKGRDSSGILTLSPDEVTKLTESLKPVRGLLRGAKKL
ncbi:hypothetical protein KW805_02945 [Candidatus Pacearchaeota archaeon]|nr:hypothetical protein [Candidatus Pacearchaeota archaeon]